MKRFLLLIVAMMSMGVAGAREFRDFTNLEGKKIHAELLDVSEGMVKIRTNNKVFTVPVETLSQEDRDWLAEWDAIRQGNEDSLYYTEVMWEDDFSGDTFSESWGHYKSESILQDGVMVGKTVDINVHAGCDSVRFEGRKDMEVSVKFNFAGEEAERFNVWFDDKDYKGSHAGHICSVVISPTYGSISDAKTGSFENSIYEKKKSTEGLDEDTKQMLESKTTRFELDLDREKYYELLIQTKGENVEVQIDGEVVGEFQSEGIGHETKSLVSLTTYINDVHYDDFVVKAGKPSREEE